MLSYIQTCIHTYIHTVYFLEAEYGCSRLSAVMCMYVVWVYVCVCVCMYVCMYTYIRSNGIKVCMHACMYVCIHLGAADWALLCVYVCMHACMHACMYAYGCGRRSAVMCVYVRMYVCICVDKYNIHIQIQKKKTQIIMKNMCGSWSYIPRSRRQGSSACLHTCVKHMQNVITKNRDHHHHVCIYRGAVGREAVRHKVTPEIECPTFSAFLFRPLWCWLLPLCVPHAESCQQKECTDPHHHHVFHPQEKRDGCRDK